jgi:hypothetical protein
MAWRPRYLLSDSTVAFVVLAWLPIRSLVFDSIGANEAVCKQLVETVRKRMMKAIC